MTPLSFRMASALDKLDSSFAN
ncbi:hypothetical protein MACJ_003429 [Theileria orientalis]|uniref:Uncharacterized protein n=1 Tax=Theileria orientalis TaxID=68886 RepID=A0A976XJR2_THEOR|nr:hypothetical protein MACJ_003429 [Theileria orientalis]